MGNVNDPETISQPPFVPTLQNHGYVNRTNLLRHENSLVPFKTDTRHQDDMFDLTQLQASTLV